MTQATQVRSPVEATLMFSLSLAVLFNQLYMYSMYPSAVVGGSYVLYCVVECKRGVLVAVCE